jgi:ubiquinone biosynthesis protein Coq4
VDKIVDSMTVSEGISVYLKAAGVDPSSTYKEKWSRIQLGPVFFYIPNTKTRQKLLKIHDLHHVATGFAPSPKGEAQISAWEIAQRGWGYSPFIWTIIIFGVAMGAVICPSDTLKAYRLGRRTRNLFRDYPARYMKMTVGELRRELGLNIS